MWTLSGNLSPLNVCLLFRCDFVSRLESVITYRCTDGMDDFVVFHDNVLSASFLNEVHESASSVLHLAPIICGAKSLSQ